MQKVEAGSVSDGGEVTTKIVSVGVRMTIGSTNGNRLKNGKKGKGQYHQDANYEA